MWRRETERKTQHSTASEVYAFVVWMLDASKKLPSRNHWVGIYVHHLTAKYQIILLLILPTFAFRCSGKKISETWSGERNEKVTKKSFSTPRLSTSGGKFITKRWHIRQCAVGDAKRDKTSLLIWKKVRNRKIKSLGTSRNNGTPGRQRKITFHPINCRFVVFVHG